MNIVEFADIQYHKLSYQLKKIKDGILEIQIYIASYDEINIVKNESDVADKVLAKYIDYLEDEDVIIR